MRLILDLNSLLNAALLGGTDHENGRKVEFDGRQIQVNSALYGVDNFFVHLKDIMAKVEVAPRSVIGVWDGKNSKNFRRMRAFEGYKAGRDKAPEISEQLNSARDTVNLMMRDLGITTMVCDGIEADDVIAYLVQHLRYEANTIGTSDGDLTVLVDSNTHILRLGVLDENPYGPFPHKYITLYKSLVGDTSDKIPGAKGFGDVAWIDLVRIFGLGGLDAMIDLVQRGQLHTLVEDLADFPKLKLIMDNAKQVYESWSAARLYPHEVNTLNRPLEITAGMVKQWAELPDISRVHDLKTYYGTKTLVTAENYKAIFARLQVQLVATPEVALDIETSSCVESDDWMETLRKRTDSTGVVDPLGHELTGMGLTFGDNMQHSVYMSVDHLEEPGCSNITVDQCRAVVELIPQTKHILVQNRSFEFSILYRTWGDKWAGNGWHGFLPNSLDTALGASYVNENLPRGLKQSSNLYLGYEQTSYADVTTVEGPVGTLSGGAVVKEFAKTLTPAVFAQVEKVDTETGEITVVDGKILDAAVTQPWECRSYKMNQLTGKHVLNYGCDDTICTAALHNHYRLVMQLESSWNAYLEVETLPEYLTSLAYVQGLKISKTRLRELEVEDGAIRDQNWIVLRDFLMEKGWAGTKCPVFEQADAAAAKVALEVLIGEEFSTRKRKVDSVAAEIRAAYPDNEYAAAVADCLLQGDVGVLNQMVAKEFTGEPKLNLDSPRQVQKLLYEVIGITPRIYNKLTDKEREDDGMRRAFNKLRDFTKEPTSVEVTAEDRAYWAKKATTDDDAVETALHYDKLEGAQLAALEAFSAIKSVDTRFKLFYRNLGVLQYWKTGLIHSSFMQSGTVTRRYTSSKPNMQQVSANGEGSKVRTVFTPHHKDAVFVSLDISSQELKLIAHSSGDLGMRDCYLGDNLKDIHSLVAVQAAPFVWGHEVTYADFMAMRKSSDPAVKAKADALRAKAKSTVFGSAYGMAAPKLAISLKVDEATAQAFLDALDAAFPRINLWKDEVNEAGKKVGFSTTLMGARRHLGEGLGSGNRWEVMRAERQLSNAVIQNSGSEQTKLALANLWKSGTFTDGRFDARFVFTVHDEICATVHRDQAVEFILEAHKALTQSFGGMEFPVASSVAVGLDFSCPVEIGDAPDAEKIKSAVGGLFA